MKSYIARKILSAAAVSMVAAQFANADTQLTINYDETYQGNIVLVGAPGSLGTPGGVDGYLTALQATYSSGDATSLPSITFNTFCFDIGEVLVTSGSWQATALPTGADGHTIPYVSGGLLRAASLYNAYVGEVNFTTPQGQLFGAALQLAIWNDLYNDNNMVGSGVFSVSGGNSAPVVALANSILQSQANVANPNLNLTFWEATAPVDNQDLISLQSENGFVPEPGTYSAAAFACAYLGFKIIRWNQKRSSAGTMR